VFAQTNAAPGVRVGALEQPFPVLFS